MSASKRIPVSEERWEELGDLKGAGQSWDDLIAELVDEHKKSRLFREVREAHESDEFRPLDEVIPPEDDGAA
jgi:predicted CopG family antitoxin